jgi:hypothetical protein
MRLPVRFFAAFASLAVLFFNIAAGAQSQSSSSQSATAPTGESAGQASTQGTANGTYISVNPLAGVNYNNRFDLSLGMAYDHMKAGPTLLQGSNLGGITLEGSYWLRKRWGLEGSFRPYFGTSGAGTGTTGQNVHNIVNGPFVSEYFFTAGPEWLGPHNQHGDLIAHVLVGGVYGNFEKDLRGLPPSAVDFYNDQVAPAVIMGGHMDLNRSARWVFRITPDAVLTRYGINYGSKITQTDVNFAISVGVEYKFRMKR